MDGKKERETKRQGGEEEEEEGKERKGNVGGWSNE